ncbi:hypothetical protein [Ensifer sp. BR816]|uniref:hypothetical protein n=1 Tax=Rhizobium sp. (strain BR816) TaxID=1057002 RepID=UPI000380CE44|nr:hypothetical protein [Ensifer sp. BR816]
MHSEKETNQLETAALATTMALAAKVVLTLWIAGLRLTPENAEQALRLILDPSHGATEGLIEATLPEIRHMLSVAGKLSPPTTGTA